MLRIMLLLQHAFSLFPPHKAALGGRGDIYSAKIDVNPWLQGYTLLFI